ncbi:pyridoxamine 5'-phosphate oxidase family protein [Nocardioides aequoreus]|uniref:pyridoxamine 5'-phosphate oxidase family protein n=1 Tax=Nocardioides aequoreus TaxID=397278 RepID=UPI0004C3330C|nr:PPOX class F420-dependent oxidoreductase [Nocardioides aequoreus]
MSRHRELAGEHLDFWRERHLCSVVTLGADGTPHVVPMGVAVDPERGQAWAITSGTSQKVANLRRDPRIAVSQVDGRRWSTLHGTAEVLEDLASVAEAERRYAARYRQPRENPARVALRITLAEVIGNV